MKQNLKTITWFVIILAILSVASFYYLKNHPVKDEQTFTVGNLKFIYPNTLTKETVEGGVKLSHSIPHNHPEVCDFKGDAPALTKLVDFSATFKFVPKDLGSVVKANESPYLVDNFLKENTLTLSEGTIDEYKAGRLNGYQITSGVEGCGHFTYYFPISSNETLMITRPFVPEFNSINSQTPENLKLPNVIKPNEAETLFRQIITSGK